MESRVDETIATTIPCLDLQKLSCANLYLSFLQVLLPESWAFCLE